MKAKFYLPEKSLNDATIYYVNLIKTAFIKENIEVETYNTLDFENKKTDYIVTIRVRDFINVYLKTRSNKIIMWFQGVSPEEYLMINNYSFKAKIVSFLFSSVERLTIKLSFFNFFVSNAMKVHYNNKFNYDANNYSIIPCYNKYLNKACFKEVIKKEDSFVYAGSLFTWQCFEKTIELYSQIEKKNNNASLTILTKEIDEANIIINKYKIENYSVYYVPLEKLDDELSKFKYGFLLRENDLINNVSTPTKMNSYLSVGLIPIYTNVIQSFEENIKLGKFEIKLNHEDTILQMTDKILQHDKIINYDMFYNVCLDIFQSYYCDDYNILSFKQFLSKNKKNENKKK